MVASGNVCVRPSLTLWVMCMAITSSAALPGTPFRPPQLTLKQLRQAAELLDPELMLHAPPDGFLADTKNPCWMVTSGQTHCLPYAYVTGTFQAGATSLYDKLSRHPRVVQSGASRWQFWGEDFKKMAQWVEQLDKTAVASVRDKPATDVIVDGSLNMFNFYWSAGYRAHRAFGAAMKPCWEKCSSLQQVEGRERCQALCYPPALADDRQVADRLGGEVHVPLLVSAVYGERQPKLIVVLRNPAERLHAAFWEYSHYHSKYGKTPDGYLAFVKEQIGAMRACEARGASLRDCALYFEAHSLEEEKVFFHCDQVIRGMYSIFLEVWLHYFKSNVLVIQSEDYFADPTTVLQRVFKHLAFEQADLDDGALGAIEGAGRPRPSGQRDQTLLPEARRLVAEFYAPFNEALAHVTGDKTFLEWNTGKFGLPSL